MKNDILQAHKNRPKTAIGDNGGIFDGKEIRQFEKCISTFVWREAHAHNIPMTLTRFMGDVEWGAHYIVSQTEYITLGTTLAYA